MTLLEMRNISKYYPGVRALHDVHFTLYRSEVHALVGENGAGKSTLMKILSGAVRKNDGSILIDGEEVDLPSPFASLQSGIGIIYQEFNLVPELSVAENIMLGHEPLAAGFPIIDSSSLHATARSILARLGEHIDTRAPVRSLSVAQRQMVEIAKAISRSVRILAMDEPTASLSDHEVKNLFSVIRQLKDDGVGIIYVSHRLDEVFEIADRITVLRDGCVVASCSTDQTDRAALIRSMVGRDLEDEYPTRVLQRGNELLRVEHLNAEQVHDVSLTLYQGEILGIAGLVGAGRTELARVIFGADPMQSGRIVLDGKEIHPRTPREAIEAGIGLLTEDRNLYGLLLEMTVRENISLSNLVELTRGPFIISSREQSVAASFLKQLDIKTPSMEAAMETLSGGNRQKVVLARWLFTKSRVLIFDEPTVGIDVGAKYEIYTIINQLAQKGTAILMISSDMQELLGLCDRIVVMCEGRVTGVLTRSEATQEKILKLATSFSGTPQSTMM